MDASLKRSLKSRGQTLQATAWVGKEGVHEALLVEVRRVFAEHDLVKVKVAASDGAARKALAHELAEALAAEVVAVVGGSALLYRGAGSSASSQA